MRSHLPKAYYLITLLALGAAHGATPVSSSADDAKARQQAAAQRLGEPVVLTNSINMKLVLIPAGMFVMGSPEKETGRQKGEDQHEVTLTRPFYMSATEVTQAQWLAIMDENPSFVEGDDHPVDTVNWHEAVRFCRQLSEREGVTYRLPTEAEWEYACRAGTTTRYHTGASLNTNQANYDGRADGGEFRDESTAVRTFAPNAWGLYDMHGNIWEWCADWHADYPDGPVRNPKGPVEGTQRAVRGGCWVNAAAVCRSATRGKTKPDRWNFHFGFRVVRDVD